jgi:hypothetical protein
MPRTSGNRGGGGRFRVTDDAVVTVGTDVQGGAWYSSKCDKEKRKRRRDTKGPSSSSSENDILVDDSVTRLFRSRYSCSDRRGEGRPYEILSYL